MLNYLPKPATSFLQWHITERCNLRCKHCYQTSYETPELPFEKLKDILEQYIELLEMWGIRGRIQLTGGEPFVREDMFDLLEEIYKHRRKLVFGIMSNGYYVTKDNAKKLKDMDITFFQVSIEGDEITNDNIRGKGSYQRIIQAAKILVEEGIRTSFSFTASQLNWKLYKKVIELGKEIGVDTVWSDRLVPWGVGKGIQSYMLQPSDLKEHYKNITTISKEHREKNLKTNVSRNRTLYFMAEDTIKKPTHAWDNQCDGVGTRGITILPQGDVYPCRRLPIKVGNLQEQSLFEIWYGSNWMWKLRDKNNYRNPICGNCELFNICGGGAPCIAYGYSGTPFATDPQCWKAFNKIPEPEELKAMVKESDKEPDFWEHIIIQDNSKDLGEHLEIIAENIYYCNGKKIVLEKTIDGVNSSKNILLELDLENVDFEKLFYDIVRLNPEISLISIKNYDLNHKEKLIAFLNNLKQNNINFKLTKPLPREWFGFEYYQYSRLLNFPSSWRESLELFIIENGAMKLPDFVKADVPELRFMPSRMQIYEYFEHFYRRMNKKDNAVSNGKIEKLLQITK